MINRYLPAISPPTLEFFDLTGNRKRFKTRQNSFSEQKVRTNYHSLKISKALSSFRTTVLLTLPFNSVCFLQYEAQQVLVIELKHFTYQAKNKLPYLNTIQCSLLFPNKSTCCGVAQFYSQNYGYSLILVIEPQQHFKYQLQINA